MAEVDQEFRHVCRMIKIQGREYHNKNRGVSRLQIPSYTFQHDMADGFPAITNKKLPFKFVKGELIWFLRGDTNIKYLVANGIPIWNKDAYNLYVKVASNNLGPDANNIYFNNGDGTLRMFKIEEFVEVVKNATTRELIEKFSYGDYTMGDVGRNYSAQWRDYQGEAIGVSKNQGDFLYEKHDQIHELILGMRKDIMSSRLKVNAWNPAELDLTALPPCHDGFQVIGVPLTISERLDLFKEGYGGIDVSDAHSTISKYLTQNGVPEFGFELHWNQRSVDTFLGLPFNIASYALLAKFLEEVTGFPAVGIEGALKCVHFYDNQYEAVDLLMSRDADTHKNCELVLSENFKIDCKEFKNNNITLDELFERMSIDSFKLKGYASDEEISVEMLAPKSI